MYEPIVINSGRRTGKTTALIKLSSETQKIIICPNQKNVKLIKKMAIDMNLKIPNPLTIEDVVFRQVNKGFTRNGVLVDDADVCLSMICNDFVVGITITGINKVLK